jgi:hypothetical protein
MAKDINLLLPFLWPPPAAPLEPRWQVESQSLPVTTSRRPPGAKATAAWSAYGTAAPRPSTRRRRPGYTSPSSGPWRQSRGWDSGTPLVKMPGPEIFLKKSFPGNYPLDGTQGKKFKPVFDRGTTQMDRPHRYPLKKRLHASVVSSRFDQGVNPGSRGVIAGGAFGGQGQIGERRRHPSADFFPPAASGTATSGSAPLAFGPSWKPHVSGRDSWPRSMIRPGNFPGVFSIQTPFARVPIYER